ncbi:MAG: heavy metal translocating P-type ATPase [Vicinamibacteria bacterium]
MTAESPGRADRLGESLTVALSVAGIVAHFALRFGTGATQAQALLPLQLVLGLGGGWLLIGLVTKLARRQFGSDILAGIAIVTAAVLGEYLAGAVVVLMLAGGQALERFAVTRASSALEALAKRMPSITHRRTKDHVEDVALSDVRIGDHLVVFPHELCPVDGKVLDGNGTMDESYLTGEPFVISKSRGSEVYSGAINGDMALDIEATRLAVDSRYARITRVMRESEQRRPKLRRLGDQLGAAYTPIALFLAVAAWWWSHDPVRFLAVLVVATPCPLLIGIPVAIMGSISLAARKGIIVRNPAVLEQVDGCRTIVLDKTGTLTYGTPTLTDQIIDGAYDPQQVLQLAASIERYSRHPLALPILSAASTLGLVLQHATDITERPGDGLQATVGEHRVRIGGRRQFEALGFAKVLPEVAGGLECMVAVDDHYAGAFRFRDAPRGDSRSFVGHLGPFHHVNRVLLVSGDREHEVRYLADHVGITEVYAGQSPEEKVAITRAEVEKAPTIFIGDGINDAPALAAATIGIAFGNQSEVTSEAADVVIMDTSLKRVDEFFHISRRMRRIAMQSAVGGMALSVVFMLFAFAGHLTPVTGAVVQEFIDLAAVLNALRAAIPGGSLSDY